jgi:hypothetical protein
VTALNGMTLRGFGDLQAALTRGQAQAALAARSMVELGSMALIREAQANFSGSHKRGQPHVPNANNYPNVVTGNLRRSIHSDGIRMEGPATFTTRVGPSARYGRRVELGLYPTGSYPYFGPAVKRLRPVLDSMAAQSWARALRF